jgi:hypothetical protein
MGDIIHDELDEGTRSTEAVVVTNAAMERGMRRRPKIHDLIIKGTTQKRITHTPTNVKSYNDY